MNLEYIYTKWKKEARLKKLYTVRLHLHGIFRTDKIMSTKGQKTDQQLAELEVKEAELMPKGQEGIFVGKRTGLHCAVAVGEGERRSVVSDSMQPHRLYSPWNSPGQNAGVGSLSLLQRIFPTQE